VAVLSLLLLILCTTPLSFLVSSVGHHMYDDDNKLFIVTSELSVQM